MQEIKFWLTVPKSSFPKCKSLLEHKGIYISSELGPKAQNLYLPLITYLTGGKRVLFPIPKDCKRSVNFMNDLLKNGEFDKFTLLSVNLGNAKFSSISQMVAQL